MPGSPGGPIGPGGHLDGKMQSRKFKYVHKLLPWKTSQGVSKKTIHKENVVDNELHLSGSPYCRLFLNNISLNGFPPA